MLTLLDVSSLTLLLCACVHMYVRAHVCAPQHMSHVFFSASLFYSYETGSPTEPEGCDLGGRLVPAVLLSLHTLS